MIQQKSEYLIDGWGINDVKIIQDKGEFLGNGRYVIE